MSNMVGKLAYKPVGMVLGAVAGAASSALFKQAWHRIAGDEVPPKVSEEERGWREVLIAATLQGAIYALVRAAVSRAGATGMRKATGYWPG